MHLWSQSREEVLALSSRSTRLWGTRTATEPGWFSLCPTLSSPWEGGHTFAFQSDVGGKKKDLKFFPLGCCLGNEKVRTHSQLWGCQVDALTMTELWLLWPVSNHSYQPRRRTGKLQPPGKWHPFKHAAGATRAASTGTSSSECFPVFSNPSKALV